MVGRHVGKYRLVRQLGEGGMGVVYEGVREDIAQRAALKILRPEYATNPDLAGRFFNEARAANLIAHPGIVKVYDYGHIAGVAYLAMEYLEGESLWQRIERRGRLSANDALRLGRQIASALEAAHRVQIVHRDLKPDNVFIVRDSESPGGERAKLLDFGIAKMADEYRGSVRTQVNVIMGTPTYMAPEQCRGSKGVADKTDVYALGVMLFESCPVTISVEKIVPFWTGERSGIWSSVRFLFRRGLERSGPLRRDSLREVRLALRQGNRGTEALRGVTREAGVVNPDSSGNQRAASLRRVLRGRELWMMEERAA
jgi:serine/threonine protein kinase